VVVLVVSICLCAALSVVVLLLAICGHWFTGLRLGPKLAVQAAWWAATVPAMWATSAWWRLDPASGFRALLAVLGCVALPGLGVMMAARTLVPSRGDGSTPWLRPAPRSAAGAGALRNARLRRD